MDELKAVQPQIEEKKEREDGAGAPTQESGSAGHDANLVALPHLETPGVASLSSSTAAVLATTTSFPSSQLSSPSQHQVNSHPISQPSDTSGEGIVSSQHTALPSNHPPDALRQEPLLEQPASVAMADNQPKEGDQVSWQWSGSRPGGEVTEVKEGTVEMTTKNNNVVKKDGEPGNPAVRIERSGHDVVKKASEVDVEKEGDKHKEDQGEEKTVGKDDEKKDDKEENGEKKENGDAETGDKRKAEETSEEKKDEEGGDSKKQKKSAEPKENGEAPKKKGRPAKKDANGETKPKKETKKKEPKRAATESGEPRRSGRNRS